MRKLALLLTFALLPTQAWALSTNDLLSTIAMPLAVAAVSNVNGVPQSQLANLVVALNQANVPPTQFVQVIRYVPVALVDQNGQPFIAYVQQETTQGITGNALVDAIVSRLQSNYNITPTLDLTGEPTTYVVQDNYIPPDVMTQLANYGGVYDPTSLVALPLAVAAVSDITGVPQDQLATLVTTLDSANVPPLQEIEIIRYAPVALVVDNGQPFVQYVQQQVTQGVTGPALVPVVVQQLQTYYPAQTQIVVNPTPAPTAVAVPVPQPAFVERDFIPRAVTTRVEEVRANPHGGPPGQIKKQLGLQTGAEVVHGEKRGRQFTPAPAVAAPPPAPVAIVPKQHGRGEGHGKRAERSPAPAPMISSSPAPAPPPARMPVPAVAAPQAAPPGQAKGHPEGGPPAGGPPGQAKPKGGKEHGKD